MDISAKFDVSLLYIEPDQTIRENISKMLKGRVAALYLARDGKEGINLFNEKKPDIVITNLTMPFMNGLDLAYEIKSLYKNIQTVLAVTKEDIKYLYKSFNIGISYYLFKPFTEESLLSAINACIETIMLKGKVQQQNEFINKLWAVAEKSRDSAIIIDKTGHIEYTNLRFTDVTGYKKEEVRNKKLDFLISDYANPNLVVEMWNHIKSGMQWQGIVPKKNKNGDNTWTTMYISNIENSKSLIMHIVEHQTNNKYKEPEEKASKKDLNIFTKMISLANDVVLLTDKKGKITLWNAAAEKMFDYIGAEMIGAEIQNYLTDDKDNPAQLMENFPEGLKGKLLSLFFTKKDGSKLFVEASFTVIEDADSCYIMIIIRSTNHLIKIREALYNEKRKFLATSENAPFGIMLIDKDGKFEYLNKKFQELFGYSSNEIPDGKTWFRKAHPNPEYRHEIISAWMNNVGDEKAGRKEPRVLSVTCKDGTEKIVNFIPVKIDNGEFIVSCEDMTELKKSEHKLLRFANYDMLTGLPNRRSLEMALHITVDKAKKGDKRGNLSALLFLGIDDFKYINQSFGHGTGDEVLITVGKLLNKSLRTGDSAFRFEGDEFAILFRGISMAEARLAAERLQNIVNQYAFVFDYTKYSMTISMGLIQINGKMDVVTLLSLVVKTMHKAKALGKNSIAVY